MGEVKWIKIVVDIFDDEKIKLIESMDNADCLLVIWFKLLCMAGKMNNDGVMIMRDSMPYTNDMFSVLFKRDKKDIDQAFRVFEQFGMIEFVNEILTIPNWEKHQSIDAMSRSRESSRNRVKAFRERQRALIESPKKDEISPTEEESPSPKKHKPPPEKAQEPAVYQLPLIDGSTHPITVKDVEGYEALFPAVDVHQQFRTMISWLDSNPGRRKTAKGIKRFVHRWLSDKQDRSTTVYRNAEAIDHLAQQTRHDVNPFEGG